MLHFVTSYMKQNKSRKQTLESAQYGLEISFKYKFSFLQEVPPLTSSLLKHPTVLSTTAQLEINISDRSSMTTAQSKISVKI